MTKTKRVFGFDYDGTIINIEPQKAQCFGEVLQKHWSVNKKEAADTWIAEGGTSRRSKFDYFYDKQFHKPLTDEDYKRVESDFSSILKSKYYPKIQLLPHAREILDFVRFNFEFVFVSSGVPMEEIRYLVKLNGVSRYFNAIYGTNNQYLSKHDHFRQVIKTTNPQVIIYLADGLEDMKVAKEFGIISIGLPTNHATANLQAAGAAYVCDHTKVINVIQKILNEQN